MAGTSHRINRLRLDVEAENAERAFSIRRRLHDDWPRLLNELEADFDTLAGEGSWLRIPRLHFRIRVANTQDLEQRLPALLHESIGEQLPLLQQSSSAATARDAPSDGGLPATVDQRRVAGAEFRPDMPADTRVDRISLEQMLEHYLLYGNLPWFASEPADWRQRFETLIEDGFESLLARVIEQVSAAPALRLLNLVADAPLLRLLAGWFGERPAASSVQPLLEVMLCSAAREFASRHQRSWVVAALLRQAVRDGGLPAAAAVTEAEWRIPPAYRLPRSRWQALLRRAGAGPNAPLAFGGVCTSAADEEGRSVTGGIETRQARGAQPRSSPVSLETSPAVEVATQPVRNAGLVLLHPYLARFFEACAIDLRSDRPASEVYDLAAAALYYLAAGEAEPAEYELGLIKILLGLEPSHPLPLGPGLLGEPVKLEAGRLLDSFIGHWSALKSTSRDGLRGAFLQRPALLRDGDDNWLLQVESGGIDVLLERLPFSYSIVKLPWMQKPIQVEW